MDRFEMIEIDSPASLNNAAAAIPSEDPEVTLARLLLEESASESAAAIPEHVVSPIAAQRVWNIDSRGAGEARRAADLLDASGLNFRVEKRPVFLSDGSKIPDNFATVRTDTGAALGIVGDRYRPIQNASAFEFMDSAVSDGHVRYHNAGSLDGGARTFLQVEMTGRPMDLPGGEVVRRFTLLNSHNGSTAFMAGFSPVRIVCQNTFAISIRNCKSGINIRHTASADGKIAAALEVLKAAQSYFGQFELQAARMAAQKFTIREMTALAQSLIPGEHTRSANARDRMVSLFEYGKGHSSIRGTRWAAANAVSEFADHSMTVRASEGRDREEARLDSVLFGSSAALKETAWWTLSDDSEVEKLATVQVRVSR